MVSLSREPDNDGFWLVIRPTAAYNCGIVAEPVFVRQLFSHASHFMFADLFLKVLDCAEHSLISAILRRAPY